MRPRIPSGFNRGFSLIELMVSVTVLLIIMAVLLQITGAIGEIWKSSSGKISAFQNGRSAFVTMTRTLSRATLNTYNDYVNSTGEFRVNLTGAALANFSPVKFARASELHFISGPTSQIVLGANASVNPGHAVLFQAPLGFTDEEAYKSLNRTLNSVGFFIQYSRIDNSIMPSWLSGIIGTQYRYRLVQVIEPTEKLGVYTSTTSPTKLNYDKDWADTAFQIPPLSSQPRPRVLAEDICLLVLRPRLAPGDEASAATKLSVAYNPATEPGVVGSVLSPNYHYDSRAWETSYPAGQRVLAASSPTQRKELMRNQLPPIVDLVLVSLDRRSLNRFKTEFTLSTPPAVFAVPSGAFTDAKLFEADLTAYSQKLSDARIRHRVFRTAVELQTAKWSTSLE